MQLTTPRQPVVPDPLVARQGWTPWQRLGGMPTTRPSVGLDPDGTLHVLARGAANRLWHAWQSTPGGSWAIDHAARSVDVPVLAQSQDGRLEVFVRDASGVTYHARKNAPRTWEPILGGHVASDVAVVRTLAGRCEIFASHPRGQIAHAWQSAPDGAWTPWCALGGSPDHATTPAVALDARGDVQVFVRWQDGSIRHRRMHQPDGARQWLAWEDLRGVAKSDPVVAAAADGRLAVFVIGMDGALHVTEQRAPA